MACNGIQEKGPGLHPGYSLTFFFSPQPVFSFQPAYNAEPHRRLRADARKERKIGQGIQRLEDALVLQFHQTKRAGTDEARKGCRAIGSVMPRKNESGNL